VKGRILKDKRDRITQGVGQHNWQDPASFDQLDSESDRDGDHKQSDESLGSEDTAFPKKKSAGNSVARSL
jgi:hypothetical protein